MSNVTIAHELEWLRPHAERLVECLGLPGIDVQYCALGYGTRVESLRPLTVFIDVRELHSVGMSAVRGLAHEMRHCLQLYTGRLQHQTFFLFVPDIIWDNQTWAYDKWIGCPHPQRPWEQDAIQFECWYMDAYGREHETTETREMHYAQRAKAA